MSLLAALLLAAQPAPAPPSPSQIHNFHDWVVTCDNGLTCEAVSLVPEEPPPSAEGAQQELPWERFGVMRLQRGPGPHAPLVISITDFDGRPARLVQYGRPIEGIAFTQAGEGEWRVEPTDRGAFVTDLYSERMIVQDESGRALAEFAVRGAHGALIYMDERQGRLGTPTSLIRPGRREAAAQSTPVPIIAAAPPTTEAPLAVPAARLAQVRRESGCSASELGGTDEAPAHALGNGRTLILLSCGAGAYNLNSTPYIAWREGGAIRVEPAALDVDPEEAVDDTPRHYLTNAQWDPERRMLHEFARGRGLGDCGVQASYVWTGTMFRLAEQREMSECRGTFVYLTTWRTEVR